MVKNGSKMPSFCLARIRPHVRVRSPTIQLKENHVNSSTKTTENNQKTKQDCGSFCNEKDQTKLAEDSVAAATVEVPVTMNIIGRKVMIVVDSSVEAKNALQWALTHTVQTHDILVLLYVKKITSSKQGNELTKEVKATKVPGFLCSMINMCQIKYPHLQVEISIVEGKEKATTIVEEAKKQEVSMLVLGQKKQPITWRLLMTWAGKPVGGHGGVVDYCVQNATCMAVAVRRKSKRVGGYLITTKRQKDFWLLA